MDGRDILDSLGVTQRAVRGAIKGLLDNSPELKQQVREIVGSTAEYERVGEINGEPVYARR